MTKTSLHICLSSRHYPHIRMKKHLTLVIGKRDDHGKDIIIYVGDKLTKWDAEIEESVLREASGSFMWLVLVVAMLNRAYDDGKVEAMHRKLHDVPSNLEDVSATLLSKDEPDQHETILMPQMGLSRGPAPTAGRAVLCHGGWHKCQEASGLGSIEDHTRRHPATHHQFFERTYRGTQGSDRDGAVRSRVCQ